jgi:hypothetical protein
MRLWIGSRGRHELLGHAMAFVAGGLIDISGDLIEAMRGLGAAERAGGIAEFGRCLFETLQQRLAHAVEGALRASATCATSQKHL